MHAAATPPLLDATLVAFFSLAREHHRPATGGDGTLARDERQAAGLLRVMLRMVRAAHVDLSDPGAVAPPFRAAVSPRIRAHRCIVVTNTQGLSRVPNNFLKGHRTLEHLDLGQLHGVTHVGSYFLGDCAALKRIDLRVFAGVVGIGPFFLRGCRSLLLLDASPLARVTEIPHGFLYECETLRVTWIAPAHRPLIPRPNSMWLYNVGLRWHGGPKPAAKPGPQR